MSEGIIKPSPSQFRLHKETFESALPCAVGCPPIEQPGNKRTTVWYSYLVRAHVFAQACYGAVCPYRVGEASAPTYIFTSNS